MKEQLINVLQPHLTIASEKVAKMVANIEKETAEMTKVETNVKQEEEIAEQQAIIAQEIKNKCDRELGKVMPQYNAAIAALNEIKPLVSSRLLLGSFLGVKLSIIGHCCFKINEKSTRECKTRHGSCLHIVRYVDNTCGLF